MKLDYELAGDRAVFRFPRTGPGCLMALLPFAVAGVAVVIYIGMASGSAVLVAIWSCIIGLPLLFGLALAIPTQETVDADRHFIRVISTYFFPTRREIAKDRIRQITRTYLSITLEAREESISFPCRGLTEQQAEWVRLVLVQIATTGSREF